MPKGRIAVSKCLKTRIGDLETRAVGTVFARNLSAHLGRSRTCSLTGRCLDDVPCFRTRTQFRGEKDRLVHGVVSSLWHSSSVRIPGGVECLGQNVRGNHKHDFVAVFDRFLHPSVKSTILGGYPVTLRTGLYAVKSGESLHSPFLLNSAYLQAPQDVCMLHGTIINESSCLS